MSVDEPESDSSADESPTPPSASHRARSIPAPHDKVERDGRLYLPLPHPLIHGAAKDSWGAKINSVWFHAHYFVRGIYATGVDWVVSFMDLALEYPKVAVVSLVLMGVACEEVMAEHPMLANAFRYVMFSVDEDAAKMIFPPDVPVSEAELAIDKIAAEIIHKSAQDYYQSPEYKQLELDVRAQMHREVMESVQRISGIKGSLVHVDPPAPVVVTPVPQPEPVEPPQLAAEPVAEPPEEK